MGILFLNCTYVQGSILYVILSSAISKTDDKYPQKKYFVKFKFKMSELKVLHDASVNISNNTIKALFLYNVSISPASNLFKMCLLFE